MIEVIKVAFQPIFGLAVLFFLTESALFGAQFRDLPIECKGRIIRMMSLTDALRYSTTQRALRPLGREFFDSQNTIIDLTKISEEFESILTFLQREDCIWNGAYGFIVPSRYIELLEFLPSGIKYLEIAGLDSRYYSVLTRHIARFPNLSKLDLHGIGLQDISFLASVPQLRELILQGTYIRDIAPLSELVNLRKLTLHLSPLSDFRILSGLRNLEELILDSSRVRDIAFLAGLCKLRVLNLIGSSRVTDFEPLRNLTELTDLNVAGSSFPSVTLLANCSKLRSLDVRYTPVGHLSVLRSSLLEALPGCKILQFDWELFPGGYTKTEALQSGQSFEPVFVFPWA